MDFLIAIFSFILFALAAGVTYRFGIKPDREARKQRSERALAELRRRHSEESRKQRARRTGSITNANSGPLLRSRRSN